MEEIVIKRNYKAYYKNLLVGILSLVILGFNILYDLHSSIFNIIVIVSATLCAVFALTNFFRNVSHLIKKEPAILINQKGIIDNISVYKPGEIKWENISKTEIIGKKFLKVHLKNYSDLLTYNDSFTVKLIELKIKKGGTPIVIFQNFIDFDILKLQQIIEENKC